MRDPRRLAAAAYIKGIDLQVRVAHGPHQGVHGREADTGWWSETSEMLRSACRREVLLVFVGANAELGERLPVMLSVM